VMQPDQNQIISCIICRHFDFCILKGSRWLSNAWAASKVAGRGRVSCRMLPADGAALIGAAEGSADCRGIRRTLRAGPVRWEPAGTVGRAALPHPKWTKRVADFRRGWPPAAHPFWHFNCLVRHGRWWPGTLVVTNRLRFSTFCIIN
jgi:hypothetical protein